jgi:hypothetical protein
MKNRLHATTFQETFLVPGNLTAEIWAEIESDVFQNQVTKEKLTRQKFEEHQNALEQESVSFITQPLTNAI